MHTLHGTKALFSGESYLDLEGHSMSFCIRVL